MWPPGTYVPSTVDFPISNGGEKPGPGNLTTWFLINPHFVQVLGSAIRTSTATIIMGTIMTVCRSITSTSHSQELVRLVIVPRDL